MCPSGVSEAKFDAECDYVLRNGSRLFRLREHATCNLRLDGGSMKNEMAGNRSHHVGRVCGSHAQTRMSFVRRRGGEFCSAPRLNLRGRTGGGCKSRAARRGGCGVLDRVRCHPRQASRTVRRFYPPSLSAVDGNLRACSAPQCLAWLLLRGAHRGRGKFSGPCRAPAPGGTRPGEQLGPLAE